MQRTRTIRPGGTAARHAKFKAKGKAAARSKTDLKRHLSRTQIKETQRLVKKGISDSIESKHFKTNSVISLAPTPAWVAESGGVIGLTSKIAVFGFTSGRNGVASDRHFVDVTPFKYGRNAITGAEANMHPLDHGRVFQKQQNK